MKEQLLNKLNKNLELLASLEKKEENLQHQIKNLKDKIRNQEFTLSHMKDKEE